MRLWHYEMIPILPRQQLLGQHRELAALRGNGWGKKHSTINYVFLHPWEYLYQYHMLILKEMQRRGYHPDPRWEKFDYRGKNCAALIIDWECRTRINKQYPEHDKKYLHSCLKNLSAKLQAAPEGKYKQAEIIAFFAWAQETGFTNY